MIKTPYEFWAREVELRRRDLYVIRHTAALRLDIEMATRDLDEAKANMIGWASR